MQKFLLIFISSVINAGLLSGQLTEHTVLPSQTDPSIDGNNNAHYCYLNDSVTPIDKLLVFFPGTNGNPWDYRMFLQTAANMGYHSIGLCYQNLASINIQVCPATQDPTCHGRARTEIWFGADTHDSIDISYPNSVINRLLKLINYLDNNYSSENWGQYLLTDTTINWQNVVTAGHSQGAGNATFGSKVFCLDRVIMISWIDWMQPGQNPNWITTPGPTPDSVYYGFIHTGDAAIYNGIPTTWNNLGMPAYGPIISADTCFPPYYYTHSLITSAPIDTSSTQVNFHNSTSVDWGTPIDTSTGLPVFLPIWQYLLGADDPVTGMQDITDNADIIVYPNPTKGMINISGNIPEDNNSVTVYSCIGQKLIEVRNSITIDLSDHPDGLYFIVVKTPGYSGSFRIIKEGGMK